MNMIVLFKQYSKGLKYIRFQRGTLPEEKRNEVTKNVLKQLTKTLRSLRWIVTFYKA